PRRVGAGTTESEIAVVIREEGVVYLGTTHLESKLERVAPRHLGKVVGYLIGLVDPGLRTELAEAEGEQAGNGNIRDACLCSVLWIDSGEANCRWQKRICGQRG